MTRSGRRHLHGGASPHPRFALAYDLEQQTFCHPSREDAGHIIPLPVLFDLQRLFRWFTKEHPEAGERLDEASRVTRAIREYQVPAYLVSQEEESVLRDIFDRMNNYGKRLSRAEVFAALHPAQGSGLEPASRFQQIAESIDAERGFGLLDDDTVLRSVLARRGGNVTRDIRVEFSEYRYLLVVLTRFFAHFPPPAPRNRILLRRWFWRAAMAGPGPFASSWTNAMQILATRISANDESGSVQQLLAAPLDSTLRLPSLTGFRTSAAASRIALSALWSLRPCSLLTGRPYERSDLAESIRAEGTAAAIARRILNRAPNDQVGWAANRLLVLDQELPGTPSDLLVSPPLERESNAAEFLASHALDDALICVLAQGDKTTFLKTRQQRLADIVRNFLEVMAETQLEDTPPLDSFDLDDLDEERDDSLA